MSNATKPEYQGQPLDLKPAVDLDEWQPMETARRNGERIEAWHVAHDCVYEDPRSGARCALERKIAEAISAARVAAPDLRHEVENLREKLSAIHIASRYPDMNAKEN